MLKFPIVSKKRTLSHYLIKYLFFITLVTLIFIIIFFDVTGIVMVILGLCLFISGLLMSYFKEYREIGLIGFFEDGSFSINLFENDCNENSYYFESIKEPSLIISTYEKKVLTGLAFSGEGTSGLGNFLKFIDDNGIRHKYEFFIKTKGKFNRIEQLKSKFNIPPKLTKIL